MYHHPSKDRESGLGSRWRGLISLAALFALAGCGIKGEPFEVEDLPGRTAFVWVLDGVPMTAATCAAQKVSYMEVEVLGLTNNGQVGYTQVQCDLDRYSLMHVPLGPSVIRVGGLYKDSRGVCLRLYGDKQVTTTTSYPDSPIRVDLKVSRNCP